MTRDDLSDSLLNLKLEIAKLKIELLQQRVADLETNFDKLITRLYGSKKSELSFRSAAYNPKGVTNARGTKINNDNNNTR